MERRDFSSAEETLETTVYAVPFARKLFCPSHAVTSPVASLCQRLGLTLVKTIVEAPKRYGYCSPGALTTVTFCVMGWVSCAPVAYCSLALTLTTAYGLTIQPRSDSYVS